MNEWNEVREERECRDEVIEEEAKNPNERGELDDVEYVERRQVNLNLVSL